MISIKEVAKYYAELPNQNKGLELLQIELSQLGLTADSCSWVTEFRKEPEAPIAPKGKSIAAKEAKMPEHSGYLDWQNPRCYVSKYFTVAEVTKYDRRRIPQINSEAERNILKLAKELDKVRDAWGHPLGVTSWYRPEPINAQQGGVSGSKHCYGLAADIYPLAGGSVQDLQRWLDHRWLDALGYGARIGFVHVDCRGSGGLDTLGRMGKIRWDY